MCLYISSDQEQNEKELKRWFGSRKKFAYVYKILLQKRDNEEFYRSLIYDDFIWNFSEQQVFLENRSLRPTKEELVYKQINSGFHVYISLEEAKCWNFDKADLVIVKFKVNKEDIVAIDKDWEKEEDNIKQAVCTKLEFIKVLED
jgi:hypothetical protein